MQFQPNAAHQRVFRFGLALAGADLLFAAGFACAARQEAARAFLVTCRARPKASASFGTSSVMTEPAATIAPSSILTGATSEVLVPMKTPAPISVRCLPMPS